MHRTLLNFLVIAIVVPTPFRIPGQLTLFPCLKLHHLSKFIHLWRKSRREAQQRKRVLSVRYTYSLCSHTFSSPRLLSHFWSECHCYNHPNLYRRDRELEKRERERRERERESYLFICPACHSNTCTCTMSLLQLMIDEFSRFFLHSSFPYTHTEESRWMFWSSPM